jgi:hypothetical protein
VPLLLKERCVSVQLLTMNILTKLVSVVLLSLPFIVIGGFLYKQASGSSWKEAFFKCYVVLQDVPGEHV